MKNWGYMAYFFRGNALLAVFAGAILLLLHGCAEPQGPDMQTVAYADPKVESCVEDSLNRYHILAPASLTETGKLPLVIVLDAHGSGSLAVNNFRGAVNDFPCLVVGSDLIKNNFQGFEKAILQLIQDVERKYPVDANHIILAGFSGGARMAYYFSMRYQVKGLLMCGAGPGKQLPSCPVYMIAGMGDFNFPEQYARPDIASFQDLKKTTSFFHGVHEWPEPTALGNALVLLLGDMDSMAGIRQNRSEALLQEADSLTREGDYLMAWQALEVACKIVEKKPDQNRALKMGNALLKKEEFIKYIRQLENDLKTEQKLQQGYMQAMNRNSFTWWKNELTLLNEKLSAQNGGIVKDHYLRIKGFIGILFYSRVGSMLQEDPGNPQLQTLLDSYAFAEPENPDPYYFKALYARAHGDHEAVIENCTKAKELGYSDTEKLNQLITSAS